MRTWKEQELAQWIEARLTVIPLKTDQRLLVAHTLARLLLESPEITVRLHSPARMKRTRTDPAAFKEKGVNP
jgi:hypothetical protein